MPSYTVAAKIFKQVSEALLESPRNVQLTPEEVKDELSIDLTPGELS